jgi:hypothetical protein
MCQSDGTLFNLGEVQAAPNLLSTIDNFNEQYMVQCGTCYAGAGRAVHCDPAEDTI